MNEIKKCVDFQSKSRKKSEEKKRKTSFISTHSLFTLLTSSLRSVFSPFAHTKKR